MHPLSPDDPLTKRLALVGKAIRATFQERLAERGATLPTWSVLRTLHLHPDLSQRQLAERIGVEGPTLVRHLDRLTAEGLVTRRRDDVDRRVMRVALTPAGERRRAELQEVSDAMEHQLVAELSDDQRAALVTALDLIHRSLEPGHAPAPH